MAALSMIVAAACLALLLIARGAAPMLRHHDALLTLFNVAPPPPPPPPPSPARQVRRSDRPRVARAAHRARHPDPGSRGSTIPSPTRPSIVPVEAERPSIVDVGPTLADHGIAASLAAGGVGNGGGSGAGDGDGGGGGGRSDQIPYFRAEWIRKPTQEEVDREWPYAVPPPAQPIVVLLVCEVRKGGHPFHCAAVRQTAPGRQLGALAIRLAEAALVKPVMHGAKVADPHIVIPFTFLKRADARTPAR